MAGVEQGPESANLAAWRLELARVGPSQEERGFESRSQALARQLREAPDPYAIVEHLGLPVPFYRRFNTPSELLNNAEEELAPFHAQGIRNFYVGLRPKRDGLEKFRNDRVPLAADQVIPYVTEHVSPDRYADYMLRVAEFAVGVFGVVIVINPSGHQQIDIGLGDVGPIATGSKRPEYEARTDDVDMLRYFRVQDVYRGNEPVDADYFRQLRRHRIITDEVRTAIGGIVQRIPKVDPHNESARAPRLPGRYEVVIVNHIESQSKRGKLVALCVDAQPDIDNTHPFAIPQEPLYWGDGSRAN